MSVLTAIIAIALLSSLIDWLFFATPLAELFVYRFMNPNLWRRPAHGMSEEEQKQSQMGANFIISILFAVLFVIFWTVFKPTAPSALVAVFAWFALLLPFALLEAVQIDLPSRYLAQRLAAWLVKLVFAGMIVGALLQ